MSEPIACPSSQRCQLQVPRSPSADEVFPKEGVKSSNFHQSLVSQLSVLQSVLIQEYEKEVSLLQADNNMLLQRLQVNRNESAIASVVPLDSEPDARNNFRVEVPTKRQGQASVGVHPTGTHPAGAQLAGAHHHHIRLGNIHDAGAANALHLAESMQEALHDTAPGLEDAHALHSHAHHNQSHHSQSHHSHANEEKEEPQPDRHTSENSSSSVSPDRQSRNHISKEHLPGKPSTFWNRNSATASVPAEEEDMGSIMGFMKRLVMNKSFECASAGVILSNTVVMAIQLQYNSFDIAFSIGLSTSRAVDTWPHAEEVFDALNMVFNLAFCVELLVRIAASRWQAIYSGWIWFDAIIIAIGAIDAFASVALPVNPGMLRVLRLIRLVRLFKILRAMSSFDSLFLLMKAIRSSFSAAVWAFLILAMVQIVVGLFLCQVLQIVLRDQDKDVEARLILFPYFGSFSKTILTMFQILMANWVGPVRCLAEEISEWFVVLFLAYRCFFCFAILKVIAAVFITETNRVLEHDDEITIMKRARDKMDFDKKVLNVMQAVDSFDGESLGWQELEEICTDDDVTVLLAPLGFEPKDLEKLFWLLDDGSGQVPVANFLKRLNKIRGQAKSIDILTMLKLTHRINQHVSEMCVKQGILDSTKMEEMEEARCVAVD